MRYAVSIVLLIIGATVGIVLPYFLQGKFGGMGITISTSTYEFSSATVLWFLRGLGICLGAAGVLCFVLSERDSEG
jgi:hypothetical protein